MLIFNRLLLLAILFACPAAFADVNLAQICKVQMSGTAACAASNQRWIVPVPASVIFAGTWKPWSSVTNEQVTVCATDVTPATIKCPATKLVSRCDVAGAKCPAPNTTGTFRLSWTAPTKNTDGSPLTDLAGFRIYSSINGADQAQIKDLPASTTSVELSGYGPGTYTFALSALNAAGAESARATSKPVVVKINQVPGAPGDLSITSVTFE